MGTNYYLKSKPCETCYHCQSELHIGKSSMGWKFLFKLHHHPLNIYCYQDWLIHLKDIKKVIYNEYNEKIEFEQLLDLIEKKRNGKSQANLDSYFYQDEEGYDFCSNEFS